MVVVLGPVSSRGLDYYREDNLHALEDTPDPSWWFGAGAARLGLAGPVTDEGFDTVMSGCWAGAAVPKSPCKRRTRGLDLVFAAPKDASLLLYLGRDQRIAEAHRIAVRTTLTWVERHLAGARIMKDGKQLASTTGNLAIAAFEHDSSALGDPHLHIHAVIANMTQTPARHWRSVNFYPLFVHVRTIAEIYEAELKQCMRERGYAIGTPYEANNRWRVTGLPQEAIEVFSRRSEEIDRHCEASGTRSPMAKRMAGYITRAKVKSMNRERKRALWADRGAPWAAACAELRDAARKGVRLGILDDPLGEAIAPAEIEAEPDQVQPPHSLAAASEPFGDPSARPGATRRRTRAARLAVDAAVRKLGRRGTARSAHHVRRHALLSGADGLTIGDIDREIEERHSSGAWARPRGLDPYARIVACPDPEPVPVPSPPCLASPPPMNAGAIDSLLDRTMLSADQRRAIRTVGGGQSRIVNIQGYAGPDRGEELSHAAILAADLTALSGRTAIAFLPCSPHAERLAAAAAFEIESAPRFLAMYAEDGSEPAALAGRLAIVADGALNSDRAMARLLELLLKLGADRVVTASIGPGEVPCPGARAQYPRAPSVLVTDVDTTGHAPDHRLTVPSADHRRMCGALSRLLDNIVAAPAGLDDDGLDLWFRGQLLGIGERAAEPANETLTVIADAPDLFQMAIGSVRRAECRHRVRKLSDRGIGNDTEPVDHEDASAPEFHGRNASVSTSSIFEAHGPAAALDSGSTTHAVILENSRATPAGPPVNAYADIIMMADRISILTDDRDHFVERLSLDSGIRAASLETRDSLLDKWHHTGKAIAARLGESPMPCVMSPSPPARNKADGDFEMEF